MVQGSGRPLILCPINLASAGSSPCSQELRQHPRYMLSPTDSIAGTKYIGMAVEQIQTVKNFTRGHRKERDGVSIPCTTPCADKKVSPTLSRPLGAQLRAGARCWEGTGRSRDEFDEFEDAGDSEDPENLDDADGTGVA